MGHQGNDHPVQETREREQAPFPLPMDKPGNVLKLQKPEEAACHLTHWNQSDLSSNSSFAIYKLWAWANHNFSMTLWSFVKMEIRLKKTSN